jgi:serine/threonine protein kinase
MPTDSMGTPTPGSMVTTLPEGSASIASGNSNALPNGTRFGEFEVTGVVGEGGFGIVYLARDLSLQRTVAIKEYMPSSMASRSGGLQVVVSASRHTETFHAGLRSFVNEARLLAQFDHPHLIKVYRFWEANGTAYMVMPFYEGITLRQLLRDRSEPPDEAWLLRLLLPIFDVLQLIHAENCYHRDIAPDNILILPGDRPLLLDFGAARRVVGDAAQTLTVILKPGYAPIEQYGESRSLRQGPWTDIYALAAVCSLAITGKVPPASVARMLNETMPPHTRIAGGRYSRRLLAALDRALAVQPEQRFQSVAEFRSAILGRAWPSGDGARSDVGESTASRAMTSRLAISPERSEGDDELTRSPVSARSAVWSTVRQTLDAFTKRRSIGLIVGVAAAVIAVISVTVLYRGTDEIPKNGLDSERIIASPKIEAATIEEPAKPVVPTPAPPPALTLVRTIATVHAAREPAWTVSARPDNAQLKIAKDRLRFSVASDRTGYLYVFALGTDQKQLVLLFPNAADRNNQIAANRPIDLPRTGWGVVADGPPGTNQLIAIVSDVPRDFTSLGLTEPNGIFDFARIRAAFDALGGKGLAGSPLCPANERNCGVFGSAMFAVEEIR